MPSLAVLSSLRHQTLAAATAATWLLPASRAKNTLLTRMGNTIAADAHIGPTLVLGCGTFEVGSGANVGLGNIFRRMRSVQIGERCNVGQFNQFTAAPVFQQLFPEAGHFSMAQEAEVTSRHYFDCSGIVHLERRAGVGGLRSIFQSHELDIVRNRTTIGTIIIGEYSLVGASSLVLKNAVIPPKSFVAAGSVVTANVQPGAEPGLYAGAPASWKRQMPECAWWSRETINTIPAVASDADFDNFLQPTSDQAASPVDLPTTGAPR